MKRIIALLLALVMLLGCVPAYAAAPSFVAANVSEVSGLHEKPAVPEYTMETVGSQYVLTMADSTITGDNCMIYIESYNEDYNWDFVDLYWDDAKKAFVSDYLLDTENFPLEPTLNFDMWTDDSNIWIDVDVDTGELTYACVYKSYADGSYLDCTWQDNYGWFSVYADNGHATYDSEDGSLSSYSIYGDDYDITYDAYGRITAASTLVPINGGGSAWAEWDFDLEAWVERDYVNGGFTPVDTDAPAFNASQHPAPLVLPYEVKLAPATIDVTANNVWKEYDEDGNLVGYIKAGKNSYCYYDLEGNMTSYQYSDLDNESGVRYSVDGTLLRYWGTAADGTAYNYVDPSLSFTLEDGTVISGWYTWDEEGNYILCEQPAGLELLPMLIKPVVAKDRIWYPNNTMCVAGISLKDAYGITDKWYNVVPVDLTKDGTYTFDLVASGMYLIGKANVTVAEGNVTVTYGMPWGHGYIKEEVLNWFTGVDQITAEFCEAPTGAYAFGEPVSISEDLGGAEVGLLFICNRVTYRDPYFNSGAHLTRWYSNKPEWKAYREQLMTLMPE